MLIEQSATRAQRIRENGNRGVGRTRRQLPVAFETP